MSLSATVAQVPREPAETRKLLLLIWTVTVATYLLAGQGVSLSTDDAMRLVQVRDFLAGQSWFDLTQYRLNPPDGVDMHWSRLLDLPLAMLIRVGELIMPTALAERLALTVWPAALLLVLLFGTARLARELADDSAAKLALIFSALTVPVLQHFRPGAIDHHNVQLVLMVWTLALLTPERRRGAASAGALCALSIAIGQEMAPVIAAIAALVALRWIMHGELSQGIAAAFGTAFAAGSVALFIATVPPARYTVATCDAFSIMQVLIAVCGGFGLAALAAWRGLASVPRRVAGAAGLGAVMAGIVVLGFPACVGDPYAHIESRLVGLWLAYVNEARSIASMMRDLPHEVPSYYGLPVIALALGVFRSLREEEPLRWRWLLGSCVLAVATLVAFWQVRGAATANALALPLLAAALVRHLPASDGRAVFLGLGRGALVAALLLNPLTLLGVGKAVISAAEHVSGTRHPVVISGGAGTCRLPSDYAPLARLPQGLVLGFIDAGPFVLMETPHRVLAAPYHRNIAGNTAVFDVFLSRPEQAAARLAALGVDYVAFCPGAPESHNYAAAAPEGLAAALSRGQVPDALQRIPLEGTDLVVYQRRR